jgi:hypothetical protein
MRCQRFGMRLPSIPTSLRGARHRCTGRPGPLVELMSGQRERCEANWQQAQALMRDLAEDVIDSVLQDLEAGRVPLMQSVWQLRAGLSRLRRVHAWGRADRELLVEAMERVSQPLQVSELVQLRAWLRTRVR